MAILNFRSAIWAAIGGLIGGVEVYFEAIAATQKRTFNDILNIDQP